MKKLVLFTAAIVFSIAVRVSAEMFKVPEANTAQPANVMYGGVKYATSGFTTNHTTISVIPCVIQSVIISSGGLGAYDYVELWDATSTVNTVGLTPLRLYNVNGSTVNAQGTNNAAASGIMSLPFPVRFRYWAMGRASSAAYNSIWYLHWKQED